MESFAKTNDSNSKWLSQFGLYRYQGADQKKSKYRQISFIIYGIFGAASIVIFATFFVIIVQSNLQDKSIIVAHAPQILDESYNYSHNPTIGPPHDTIITDEHLEPLHENDEQEYLVLSNHNDTTFYNEDVDNHQEALNGTVEDFDEYDPTESSGDSETFEDLDKISAEKLTLGKNEFLRAPPKPRRKKKRRNLLANRRQFDTRVMYYEPRPFDFELNGPPPASFQKHNFTNSGMTTYTLPASRYRVNNIQDILNQGEVMSAAPAEKVGEINRIQFTGTYRHPKRYNELMGIFSQNFPRTPGPQSSVYPTVDYFPSSSTPFSSDPFYKYKPRTPSEINLMALNQFRFAPYGIKAPLVSSSSSVVPSAPPMVPMKIPTYQPPIYSPFPPTKFVYPLNPSQSPPSPPQPSEYEHIYHALLNSNHASSSGFSSIDSSGSEKRVDGRPKKTKPFSLMLDIYPMTDDESISSGITSTKRPSYRLRRPIQHQLPISFSGGFGNQYSPAVGDHSYFNSINFPQIQPQRYQMSELANSFYHQSKQRDANNKFNFNNNDEAADGYEKPGQMVVHLNLFPKGNRNRNNKKHKHFEYLENRSSEELNDTTYDGTYDFQPRSLISRPFTDIATTTELSLNTGEVLTTILPPFNNMSKNFEIVRSIELNATSNINFDNIAINPILNNLANNPIVVMPNSSRPESTPIHRSDDYDITELEFLENKPPPIPQNHKIDNCTRDATNFTIDQDEVMRFEPKDIVMKQSDRDYFAEPT